AAMRHSMASSVHACAPVFVWVLLQCGWQCSATEAAKKGCGASLAANSPNSSSCGTTAGAVLLQARSVWLSKKRASLEAAGFMTMWSDSATTIVGGACEYANAANGGVQSPAATSPYITSKAYCAAGYALYAAGAACGSCWRISYDGSPATDPGRAGSLVVQLVDTGSAKIFDCQLSAFQIITGATSGIFPVTYEPVGCDTAPSGAAATVLDGQNAWYTKVIFSNLPSAVLAAELSVAGKSFAMSRVSGATWSANTDGSTGAASFVVTLEGGMQVSFPSCFASWPVAASSSCSTASEESPTPSTTAPPEPSTTASPVPSTTAAPSTTASPSPSPLPTECSASSSDCRSTGCCKDAGFQCYEKDQYWAGCRESCTPGLNPLDPVEYRSPWTCQALGSTSTTPTPVPSPPTPSPATTTTTWLTPVPTPSPSPVPSTSGSFTTSTVGSSKSRLFEFAAALTDQPVAGSRARAVHSSGGAAGGVVSEGQGYGVLISGVVLAALDENDPDRQKVEDVTYELFLGWRRMCELSADSGSCQEDEGFQCGGGSFPCLPHWKLGDDLSSVLGRGAAPDGDADAMAGMMLAVLSLEQASSRPAWYGEVASWAYETCRQFYLSATVASSSGRNRIVKLGSCWGGWGGDGQNPSYHAPGVYRLCKHYMQTLDGELGASETEGDDFSTKWDVVIATSYKMFAADQCPSTGLITNWAEVSESADGQSLTATTGFSGSGTPGAEFGSEASRGFWRVALDYLLFPEAAADASSFLSPLAAHLETKEEDGNWADSLDLDSSCLVQSVHASWSWNMFMAGPTFASLVCPAIMSATRQQQVIDSAGSRVAMGAINDYYSGSWVAISTMTLNGDIAKAAAKAGLLGTTPTSTTVTTAAPSTTTTTTTTTEPAMTGKVFEPVDGGVGRVCRGGSVGDNLASHYSVFTGTTSLDACKEKCEATTACVGIEFSSSRCEVWTRAEGIQASRPVTGYTCLRFASPATLRAGQFEPVDAGTDRACRGANASDNSASYYTLNTAVASADACQELCRLQATCRGVEYNSRGRCELWTRTDGIQASSPVSGYSCWRFVEEMTQ
ncbi:unnamed protein product, partial [Polarella glacialis]